MSAACVRRPYIALPFWVNNSFLALLTHSWILVRSYNRTTNCSTGPSHSSIDWVWSSRQGIECCGDISIYNRQPMQSSFPCLQNRTPYRTQWRHGTLAMQHTNQDQMLWLSYEQRWTWSSFLHQRQSTLQRCRCAELNLWPELCLCQLCVLTLCYTLAKQHLLGGT